MKNEKQIIPFTSNGLWGLVSEEGEILLPPTYDLIEKPSQEDAYPDAFFLVSHKNKYFYMDKKNQVISDIVLSKKEKFFDIDRERNQYNHLLSYLNYFDDNNTKDDYLYAVPVFGKIVYYNNQGQRAFLKSYDYKNSISLYFNTLEEVVVDDKVGVIDKTGNYIIKPIYDSIRLCEKIIYLNLDNKNGVWDINEKMIIPIIHDEIKRFTGKYFIVKNDKYAFFNAQGEQLTDFIYTELESVRDDKFFIYKKDNKFGVINEKFETVLSDIYDDIIVDVFDNPCRNNRWVVVLNGVSQVIDLNNEVIFKLPYTKKRTGPGKESAYIDSLDAYIEEEHNELILHTQKNVKQISCEYSSWGSYGGKSDFEKNLIFIYKQVPNSFFLKEGFINIDTNYVQEAIYDDMIRYTDYISVKQDNKFGLIDFNGNIIIETIYDKSFILEEKYNELSLNNKMGLLNNAGEIILDFKYKNIIIIDDIAITSTSENVYIINLLTKETIFEFLQSNVKVYNPYIIIYDEYNSHIYQLVKNEISQLY